MSVWSRLGEFLSSLVTDAFTNVVEAVRTVFEGDPETRRQVGFSVAMIALSAKMAKSDGVVTEEEVDAFQQIFEVPEAEARNVARLYNLARQDVAGFEAYAERILSLFPDNADILQDVIHGLFHIAKADGIYHQNEIAFIEKVASIFGIEGRAFERVKCRHMAPEGQNPYVFLEASPDWADEKLKRHYHKLVHENHPDRMVAHGVPPEFIAISNKRLAEINKAWGQVRMERGL